MIIFDINSKKIEIPAGLGNLEVNIISGSTAAGVSSIDGQQGDLTLKTVNGNQLLGSGDIVISGNPEEIITSAVTVANEYTDTVTSGIAVDLQALSAYTETIIVPDMSGYTTTAVTAELSAATSGIAVNVETLSAATSGIAVDLQTLSGVTSGITSDLQTLQTSAVTSTSIHIIWTGTQAQYDAITYHNPNTLYIVQ